MNDFIVIETLEEVYLQKLQDVSLFNNSIPVKTFE